MDATVLAAVASPRRREILRVVWSAEQPARAIHAAMPDVTFGAVSQHLHALVAAGLLHVRPDGRQRFYRARRSALGPVGRALERMWSDALWSLTIRAELEEARRGPRGRKRPAHSSRRRMS